MSMEQVMEIFTLSHVLKHEVFTINQNLIGKE